MTLRGIVIHRQEAYGKADADPHTGRMLDIGTHDLEDPGSAKHNDGFFEKGILQAKESDRRNSIFTPEIKVIANGHCHREHFLSS